MDLQETLQRHTWSSGDESVLLDLLLRRWNCLWSSVKCRSKYSMDCYEMWYRWPRPAQDPQIFYPVSSSKQNLDSAIHSFKTKYSQSVSSILQHFIYHINIFVLSQAVYYKHKIIQKHAPLVLNIGVLTQRLSTRVCWRWLAEHLKSSVEQFSERSETIIHTI